MTWQQRHAYADRWRSHVAILGDHYGLRKFGVPDEVIGWIEECQRNYLEACERAVELRIFDRSAWKLAREHHRDLLLHYAAARTDSLEWPE